jgi:pyruvate ferredoxin oxidoreductase beta subunit
VRSAKQHKQHSLKTETESDMTAPTTKLPSLNEANERDPYNNNSYGTLVDSGYKMVDLPVLDVNDFNDRIIRGYE